VPLSSISPELISLWDQALKHLESTQDARSVDAWLRGVKLLSLQPEFAVLAAPTKLHADTIRQRFIRPIAEAFGVSEVRVEVHELDHKPPTLDELVAELAPTVASLPTNSVRRPSNALQHQLNQVAAAPRAVADDDPSALILKPDYTFEQFVVGPCNRFAHAACRGVADRPAQNFNPLFLHGSVGLGKTHLMQAVCHHLLDKTPDLKIVFLSCEEFINHFISALQQGDVGKFRNRYRKADVLIIDDIQMLANKARTQEEFFHTFNTLHNSHKQIVLSSDAPPEDIPDLQERLVSRFKWGLVAEIEPPCFETRVAILHSKAARLGLTLPDNVSKFIAENVENNVRELEGSLTRIQAMAALTNRPIEIGLAHEIMGPDLRARNRPIHMDHILSVITSHYGVKLAELQSKRRTQSVVFPRQVAMYLARSLTSLSLEEVGGYFGGKDHSTVLYSVEKIEARRRVDAEFTAVLGELERSVKTESNCHG
jgi:chromosomal replication initiator protein